MSGGRLCWRGGTERQPGVLYVRVTKLVKFMFLYDHHFFSYFCPDKIAWDKSLSLVSKTFLKYLDINKNTLRFDILMGSPMALTGL